jgi:Ca-activated chloride channel homolog
MFRLLPCSILIVGITASSAQSPQKTDYTINVQVEFVELPVSVVDRDGHPVRGLTQEHFSVYEDRVMQDIAVFKQEDAPVSVGLVIDASSSMADKRDRVGAAALTFVGESNPEDEAFIVSFADRPTLEQDFTSNVNTLGYSLNRIRTWGTTSLYDAVSFAAEHLANGFNDKRVLLIVSDGADNKSRLKLNEVLDQLRESKITVYTVGLLSSDDGFIAFGPFRSKARKALEQFASVTGGQAFFPKSIRDVDEVCRRIARDVRNQYTIGYKPSNNTLDGSWRGVRVQVNPPKGLTKVQARTKQGYYAPLAGTRRN